MKGIANGVTYNAKNVFLAITAEIFMLLLLVFFRYPCKLT